MAGGSSSNSSSKPVDMTPEAFKNLQQPFANVIGNLLGFSPASGSSSTGSSTPSTPQGGSASGTPSSTSSNGQTNWGTTSGGDNSNMQNTYKGQTNTTPAGTSGATTGQATTWQGGPTPGDANSVLSGIPSYNGQTTAPITGNEQSLLNSLMGTQGNNSSAQTALNALLNGGTTQTAPNVGTTPVSGSNVSAQQISGIPQVGTSNVDPNAVTSSFSAGQNNPLLQAYITAAQRSTMDNLAQTLHDNGAQFTASGQFIQPGGSSAFDRAQALASQSAGNNMADIAANIGYQGYNLDQTLNQQTQQQNAANILAALQGNQTTGLTASQANASNALTAAQSNQSSDLNAQEANQQTGLTASEQNAANGLTASGQNAANAITTQQNAAQNTIGAATAQGNLSTQDVQDMVQNLQAQALPRLIEQYGLDQGLSMFNNQVNDLMTILQTGAGVTSPVIANQSQSSSSTKPNLL